MSVPPPSNTPRDHRCPLPTRDPIGSVDSTNREVAGYGRRRPNSLSPVKPSRWSGHAQTMNQPSPRGERQRPVHAGGSSQ